MARMRIANILDFIIISKLLYFVTYFLPWSYKQDINIIYSKKMIQKSTDQPHVHFDEKTTNSIHRLLFEKSQKILPNEYQCTLVNYLGVKTDLAGKLILTDFRVIFVANNGEQNNEISIRFDFPIGYIAKCDNSSENVNKVMVFYVEFMTKFGFVLRVRSNNASLNKVSEHINNILSQYDSFGEKRAVGLDQSQKCKKWEIAYFKENQTLQQAVNYDNQAWKYLPTYPQIFKVPKPFIGKRNQHGRIVLLSYAHEGKKTVGVWRNGPGKPDPQQEEWIPSAVKKQDHIVIQIKNKIIGTNKSLAEQMLQLDDPPHLRQSFMKFFITSCYQNETQQQQQKWLVHANFSRWYQQIQILISQAFLLLQKICEGVHITILSEWDVRGSQICALIQVLAKPENRTISGFGKLIQREFLHYGNYTPASAKKERLEDKGIALIQFLDCVFQLKKMYPLSFQFNEDMLTYIAIHIYSRKYGNFLYITRATAELNQPKYVKYACIWAKIQRFKEQFTDSFFVDHKECDIYELKKNVGMKNYRIWGSFFFRDILMYGNNMQINKVNQNHRTVLKRHQNVKNQTKTLKAKVAEQHKLISQKRKKLKELQQLQLD